MCGAAREAATCATTAMWGFARHPAHPPLQHVAHVLGYWCSTPPTRPPLPTCRTRRQPERRLRSKWGWRSKWGLLQNVGLAHVQLHGVPCQGPEAQAGVPCPPPSLAAVLPSRRCTLPPPPPSPPLLPAGGAAPRCDGGPDAGLERSSQLSLHCTRCTSSVAQLHQAVACALRLPSALH